MRASGQPRSAPGSFTVQVVIGRVRAGRLCPRIAQWVAGIGAQRARLPTELLDLAYWALPIDDEPLMPALEISETIMRGRPFDPALEFVGCVDSVERAFSQLAQMAR